MSAINTELSRSMWNELLFQSDLRDCPAVLIDMISSYLTDEDLFESTERSTLPQNSSAYSMICQVAFGQFKAGTDAILINCRQICQLLKRGPYPIEPLSGQDSIWERIKLLSGVENSISNSYIKQMNGINSLWQSFGQLDPNLAQLHRLNAAVQKLEDAKGTLKNAYVNMQSQNSGLTGKICRFVSFFFGWLCRWRYNPIDIPSYRFGPTTDYALLGTFSIPSIERDEKAKGSLPVVEGDQKAFRESYEVRARLENIDYPDYPPPTKLGRPKPQVVTLKFFNPVSKKSAPLWGKIYYVRRAWRSRRGHRLEVSWENKFNRPEKRFEPVVEKVLQVLVEILKQNQNVEEIDCQTLYSSFIQIAGGFRTRGEDADSLMEETLNWRAFAREMASLSEEQRKQLEAGTLKIPKIEDLVERIMTKKPPKIIRVPGRPRMRVREEEIEGNRQIDMRSAIQELQRETRESFYPQRDLGVSGRTYSRDQLENLEVQFTGMDKPTSWNEILKTDSIIKRPERAVLPLEVMEADIH